MGGASGGGGAVAPAQLALLKLRALKVAEANVRLAIRYSSTVPVRVSRDGEPRRGAIHPQEGLSARAGTRDPARTGSSHIGQGHGQRLRVHEDRIQPGATQGA